MKNKALVMGCLLASVISLAACDKTQVSDSTAPTSVEASTDIENPEDTTSGETSESEAKETESVDSHVITVTIEKETRSDESGREVLRYEYPVFATTDSAYDKVVKAINDPIQLAKDNEVEVLAAEAAATADAVYTQDVFDASISEQDGLIFVSVGMTEETGGPHPNNIYYSYVVNTETHEFADLTDVVPMDDERIAMILSQILTDHPDKDFDVLEADIKLAIDENRVGWMLDGKNLVVWFDYDDITGAYHGDGEYAATLPLE